MSPRLPRPRTAAVATLGALALLATSAPALASPAVVTPAAVAPALAASPPETKVLALLNRERAANGLPALTRNAKLARSALAHDQAMSAAQTLSHQLPGEPWFGDRISATGYVWRAAAENIGQNSDTSDAGALQLERLMYGEVPPDDGHRRNILSTAVTQVGVSVLVDTHHQLWLTVDFASPA